MARELDLGRATREKLTVEVAVRPTLLGLLVDRADATSISRFMRLSTCIWDGALNSIIPVTDRLPDHWTNNRVHPNGMMVAYHYLNFFGPDLLVEAQEGVAEQVGWIPERLSKALELTWSGQTTEVDFAGWWRKHHCGAQPMKVPRDDAYLPSTTRPVQIKPNSNESRDQFLFCRRSISRVVFRPGSQGSFLAGAGSTC